MANETAEDIINYAVLDAIQAEVDSVTNKPIIQNEVLVVAIHKYNAVGLVIYHSDDWINRRIAETSYTSDANKIITLNSNVDIVKGVKAMNADGDLGKFVWPQNDVLAAMRGETVSSDHFIYLPEDSSGNQQIRVNVASAPYVVLARKKWTLATIESTYDSSSPTSTPTDYRVIEFPVYSAVPAMKEALADEIRNVYGVTPKGNAAVYLQIAKNNERDQQAREIAYIPKHPMFEEISENW